jgi:hypothetical protein
VNLKLEANAAVDGGEFSESGDDPYKPPRVDETKYQVAIPQLEPLPGMLRNDSRAMFVHS